MDFGGRNDPETRRQSFHTDEISLEEHTAWFIRSLATIDRKIIIAENEGTPIGVVRLDRLDDQNIELSVFLEPGQRGKGYGQRILRDISNYARVWLPSVLYIIALVKQTNLVSMRTFSKLGYIEQNVSSDHVVTFKLKL